MRATVSDGLRMTMGGSRDNSSTGARPQSEVGPPGDSGDQAERARMGWLARLVLLPSTHWLNKLRLQSPESSLFLFTNTSGKHLGQVLIQTHVSSFSLHKLSIYQPYELVTHVER